MLCGSYGSCADTVHSLFSCYSRSPTPESPRPYLPLQQKVASPFPPLPTGTLPLTLKDLPTYIREFNSTHAKRVLLHVYLAPGHKSRNIAVPVILRFLIPNVLRAFITLGHEEGVDGAVLEIPALVVESFTVFGSREKASSSHDRFVYPVRLLCSRNLRIRSPNLSYSRSSLNGLCAFYSRRRACPCKASW